jgi:hypothetical protein
MAEGGRDGGSAAGGLLSVIKRTLGVAGWVVDCPTSLHISISLTASSGVNISAPDFEKSFLQTMKSERPTLGDPVYPILQELFEDADAYVEQAELRTEPEDLDDQRLLASAQRARHALRELGYE